MIYFSDDPNWMLDHLDLGGRLDFHLLSLMWHWEVRFQTYDGYLRASHAWAIDHSTDEFEWCFQYVPLPRLKDRPKTDIDLIYDIVVHRVEEII